MNKKQVFGTITILGITGFTIYTVWAYKKQLRMEEAGDGIITAEEAREMVKANIKVDEQRPDEPYEYDNTEEIKTIIKNLQPEDTSEMTPSYSETNGEVDMEEVHDSIRDVAAYNASYGSSGDEHLEHRNILGPSPNEVIDGFDPMNYPLVDYLKEEAKVLLYDADSIQARDQYIRMELAEWMRLEENYDIMLDLFNQLFIPQTEGDRQLLETLMDYRSNFFGQSKWTTMVTMADVILHYARLATFNLDEDVRYWTDYFLSYTDFQRNDHPVETHDIVAAMCRHNYYCKETSTHGLFGLSDRQWEDAHFVAARQVERVITFEIEFNEFMKAYI